MPRDDVLLEAARSGADGAFDRLVVPHRSALLAEAYRMLASMQDAEDAVQETLIEAWSGLPGRGTAVGPWLLGTATRVSLQLAEDHPPRTLPELAYPAGDPAAPLPEPEDVTRFIGPALDVPITLAELARLQTLDPADRAAEPQRQEVGEGADELVAQLQAAWERADAEAVGALLTDDARLSLPPRPTWFDGADAVTTALATHVLTGAWRCTPTAANGAPALVCRPAEGAGALVVVTVREDRIAGLTCFLDAAALSGLSLPD